MTTQANAPPRPLRHARSKRISNRTIHSRAARPELTIHVHTLRHMTKMMHERGRPLLGLWVSGREGPETRNGER